LALDGAEAPALARKAAKKAKEPDFPADILAGQ